MLGRDNVRQGFFGQEINLTTYNLCRINMFLHDVNYEKFDIAHGDTLTDPQHWDDEPFEAIVSNPPYSIKWDGDANPLLINDPRFAPAGVLAPKSKADLAFTMHMLSWLAVNGTAAIVEFPGVLYRGGAEQKIRKYLVDNNYVDTVIQLPPDLFFGTTIATCIIVLKKSQDRQQDAVHRRVQEFVRQGNKNKLTEANQQKILDAFTARADADHFATLVENDAIAENGYNIAVSSYVEAEDTREAVDIKALNAEIARIVARQAELRRQIDAIVADLEGGAREPDRRPHRGAVPRRRRVQAARRSRRASSADDGFTKTDLVDVGTSRRSTTARSTRDYGTSRRRRSRSCSAYDRRSCSMATTRRRRHRQRRARTSRTSCKAVAWLGDDEVAVHDDATSIGTRWTRRYVVYFFQSTQFQIRRRSSSTGDEASRSVSDAAARRSRSRCRRSRFSARS